MILNKIINPDMREWILQGDEMFNRRAGNAEIGEWIKKCPCLLMVTEFNDLSERIEIYSSLPEPPQEIIINRYSFTIEAPIKNKK